MYSPIYTSINLSLLINTEWCEGAGCDECQGPPKDEAAVAAAWVLRSFPFL